ncbi:MAG: hypothetical protein ACLVHE_00955 [Dialister invisus]
MPFFVVYSLKDIHFFSGNHGGTGGARSPCGDGRGSCVKRNMLLSMAAGTACCMALTRVL